MVTVSIFMIFHTIVSILLIYLLYMVFIKKYTMEDVTMNQIVFLYFGTVLLCLEIGFWIGYFSDVLFDVVVN